MLPPSLPLTQPGLSIMRAPEAIFTFDGWTLNPGRRLLHDPAGGAAELTSVEFDLLEFFLGHPRRAVSREEIMKGLFIRGLERSVDVTVCRLRRKLGDAAMIKSIRHRGYYFTPTVMFLQSPPME